MLEPNYIVKHDSTGYRNDCAILRMHKRCGTSIATQKATWHDYAGRVVCFEMPKGTLVLRRNGFTFVAGNSAQEIRVAAHFAEGNILKAYQDNPDLDVHTFVQDLIRDKAGMDIPRRISKTVTFLKLYGGGPQKLVDQIGCTLDDARKFFAAYEEALPEFKQLTYETEQLVRSGKKLRTAGGRLYDVEPPEVRPDGRKWEKYYKLPNVLIQSSSADMTKLAILRYYKHPDRRGRVVLQVHDELVISVPPEYRIQEMQLLRWAMNEQPGWDVPIRSTGEWGHNYGELIEMEHEI